MAKNDKKSATPEVDEEELLLQQSLAEFDAEGGEIVATSGFAPYVKPYVGLLLRFTPVMTDATNPEFIRHVCLWNGKGPEDILQGATGPVASAEAVDIKPGEVFSMSDYKGIPFEDMMGLKVVAICTEMRAMPPKNGKPRADMFVFKAKLLPDDKKAFEDRKSARMAAISAAKRALAAKEEEVRVNGLPVTPSTPAGQQALRS